MCWGVGVPARVHVEVLAALCHTLQTPSLLIPELILPGAQQWHGSVFCCSLPFFKAEA